MKRACVPTHDQPALDVEWACTHAGVAMSASVLDRKRITRERLDRTITPVIQRFFGRRGTPRLAVLRVGDAAASSVDVSTKRKTHPQVAFQSFAYDPPASSKQAQLMAFIIRFNTDFAVYSIQLQSPRPAHIDEDALFDSLDPNRARDRFQAVNAVHLAQRRYGLRPCAPKGAMTMLGHTDRPARGEHAAVVGVSSDMGRSLVRELTSADGTTICCHKLTCDLEGYVRPADTVVVALSTAGLVKMQCIKPGAVVIDTGMNRVDDGGLIDRNYAGNGRGAHPLSVRRLSEKGDGRCVAR